MALMVSTALLVADTPIQERQDVRQLLSRPNELWQALHSHLSKDDKIVLFADEERKLAVLQLDDAIYILSPSGRSESALFAEKGLALNYAMEHETSEGSVSWVNASLKFAQDEMGIFAFSLKRKSGGTDEVTINPNHAPDQPRISWVLSGGSVESTP